jgi:hypothetical protein
MPGVDAMVEGNIAVQKGKKQRVREQTQAGVYGCNGGTHPLGASKQEVAALGSNVGADGRF